MNRDLVLAGRLPAGSPASGESGVDRGATVFGSLPRRLFRPGWPVTFAFAGFGVWWVLGISNFVGHIAAAILLVELIRRRRIRVPRSFGLWLLFLVWVGAGVFVLQVEAPYAVADASAGRYVTWAYRLGWYLAATVFLLYIGNFRDRLSSQRIARALSVFFITIVAGGWLAIVSPQLEFPSLLEVVLPRGLAQVEFVRFLIHPTVVQDYAGSAAGFARPSAPFAYANFWGLNFACALPFFVLTWFGSRATWRRRAAGVAVLLLAAVPAIFSWNRGLWLAVLAMVALLALRSAARGRIGTLVGLVAGTLVVVAIIFISPLGEIVESRLDNPTSNSTRTRLATLTTESVLQGSPLIGFGTTHDSASSFYSVAGGDRPSCPDCSPPAMGTQGQFWLVLFAQGLLGLVFFFGFILLWFLRGLRARSGIATAGLCVVTAHLITTTIYDSLGIGTVVLLVAVALLWRETDDRSEPNGVVDGEYTLGGYARLVRQNLGMIVVLCLAGAMTGAAVQLEQGDPVIARASVVVPAESASRQPGFTTSLDTLTQLARSERVREGTEALALTPIASDSLSVSATPNSRILNLTFTGHDVGTSLVAVTAAAEELLAYHAALLEEERDALVTQLDARYASLLKTITTVDSSLSALSQSGDAADAVLLQRTRASLIAEGAAIANESGRVASMKFDSGRVISPAAARVTYDPLVVKSVSGLLLGLLLAVLLSRVRDIVRRPIRSLSDAPRALGVDLLATVPRRRTGRDLFALAEQLSDQGVVAVVSATEDRRVTSLATEIDHAVAETSAAAGLRASERPPLIALLVADGTSLGALAWEIGRRRRASSARIALIIVEERARYVGRRARVRRAYPRSHTRRMGDRHGTAAH